MYRTILIFEWRVWKSLIRWESDGLLKRGRMWFVERIVDLYTRHAIWRWLVNRVPTKSCLTLMTVLPIYRIWAVIQWGWPPPKSSNAFFFPCENALDPTSFAQSNDECCFHCERHVDDSSTVTYIMTSLYKKKTWLVYQI